MVGYTAALAVLAASGCSTNPPRSDSAADRSEDEHATAGAIVGGAAGAAVGAAGGAVVGGLGAVGLCAPLGILAIACAPVGVVVGGVGGAIGLGKKGAEWGAKAAAASPRSMADAPEPTEAAPASETDDAGTDSVALAKSAAQIGKDADRPAADEVTEPHGTVATPAGAAEIDQEPERAAPKAPEPTPHPAPMAPAPSAPAPSAPVALAAPSDAATHSPRPPVTGLPATGSQWVYGFIDRQYQKKLGDVTVRVVRVNGGIVEEAVSAGAKDVRRVVNAQDNRFYEHPIGGEMLMIEFAPYLLAGNDGKAPVEIGGAAGYPLGGSGLAGWVVRSSVQGWESITVPAGTFKALRIELTGDRERETLTNHYYVGRFRISIWYAPEVMRAVRVEHRTYGGSLVRRGQQIGDEALELVRYERGS